MRQDIIWAKPNPMPESVIDRCTKSHEYIFLLTKKAKYFYDAEAIKETAAYPNDNRGARTDNRRGTEYNSMSGKTGNYRNKRSVWTITTKPYSGAHYATFPPELPEICIKAGCPQNVCEECGAASCKCNAGKKPGVVLDPFNGAGTTGLVAARLNRDYIGIEINPKDVVRSEKRIYNDAPLFNKFDNTPLESSGKDERGEFDLP